MRVLLVQPPRCYWPYTSEGDNFLLQQALPALAAVGRSEGYDVKRYDTTGYGKPNNSPLEKYFMFDNVEEALINYKWYS